MNPTLQQTNIAIAADVLSARRLNSSTGPHLPEPCRPATVAAALAIQAAVSARLGQPIGAWKCGLPASDGLSQLPVLAPIYVDTIYRGNDDVPCAGPIKIEPELAFILRHDLPARDQPYLPADVDAAIGATHLALELIGSRYDSPGEVGFLEHLADGLHNQGLYLGPEIDSAQARSASAMTLQLQLGTKAEATTILAGRHPATDPRAPLYWLAEYLRSQGQRLRAGQAIITGAYVASFEVPTDTQIMLRYGDLGLVKIQFRQR
ncbi:MAG: hydratase [Pseudomonadota bacterium]